MPSFFTTLPYHLFVAILVSTTTTLILVVTTGPVVVVNAQSPQSSACNPCITGSDDLVEGNNPACVELPSRANGLFDSENDCKDLQLKAYQLGCCPSPPFDYCEYCEDGSTPNMDAIIPTGRFVNGYTCFDYSYQPDALTGMFTNTGDCSDTFLQRAGHYCGCGGDGTSEASASQQQQQQECWLCPDQQAPTKPSKGDAWVTNSNCRGIEFLFSLFREDECGDFPINSGSDLSIFCGCGGLNQTEIDEQAETYGCTLCENNGDVTNPNFVYTDDGEFPKTCRQAEKFARDIIKTPAGCRNPTYFGKAREFCTCSETSSAAAATIVVGATPLALAIIPTTILLLQLLPFSSATMTIFN